MSTRFGVSVVEDRPYRDSPPVLEILWSRSRASRYSFSPHLLTLTLPPLRLASTSLSKAVDYPAPPSVFGLRDRTGGTRSLGRVEVVGRTGGGGTLSSLFGPLRDVSRLYDRPHLSLVTYRGSGVSLDLRGPLAYRGETRRPSVGPFVSVE